jgi:heme A synthase
MNGSFWFSLSFAVLTSSLVIYALITGKAPSRVSTANRFRHPVGYWINLLFLLAFAVLATGMFVEGLLSLGWTGEFTLPR